MANFANPTVGSAYTSFPTEIRDAIAAALQQLHVGSHSNIPTNAIKWDATDNRWKKYNGSAFVDLTATYAFNAQISATQLSLGDNQKILLGVSQDFELVHDGGNSVMRETGTGSLFIQSDTQLYFGNVAGTTQYLQANGTNVELLSGGNIKIKTDGTGVLMPDNSKLRLGDAGDLAIFHDGTNSFVQDAGTGGLFLVTNEFTVTNAAVTQNIIKGFENGSVGLYYAGSEKLTTTSAGITVGGSITAVGSIATSTTLTATTIQLTGELDFLGAAAKFIDFQTINNSNQFELRHFDGSSTYQIAIRAYASGQTELYHSGNKKAETTSGGLTVHGNVGTGDGFGFNSGANADLQMRHDGTNTLIYNGTGALFFRSGVVMYFQNAGGTETYLQLTENAGYILFYDGVGQIYGQNGFVQINSNLYLQDNYRVNLGTSNDLSLFHDGANSYIYNATGVLNLQLGPSSTFISFLAQGEYMATFAQNGSVVLYHDNSAKFSTQSYGAFVQGTFIANTVQVNAGELDFIGFGPKFIDFGTHSAGSNSYVQLRHTDHSSFFEFFLQADANGSTYLAFDNATKITTTSYGSFYHGQIVLGDSNTDEKIVLQGTTNPYIRFREGTTNRAYIQYNGGNNNMYFVNEETGEHFRFGEGLHSFVFHVNGTDHNVGKGIVRAGGRFETSSGTVVSSQTVHISSITDNGTGDFTFNFTPFFGDTLYTVVAHMPRAANVLNHIDQFVTRTTAALRFTTSATPNGGNVGVYNQDPINGIGVLVFDM